MEAARDSDRRSGSRRLERRAICQCNRNRRSETDNALEPAATIPRCRYPHPGGRRWLAVRAQPRLHGGPPGECPTCLARISQNVAFFQKSFEPSWKAFECAQRIVTRLRARVEIGNR